MIQVESNNLSINIGKNNGDGKLYKNTQLHPLSQLKQYMLRTFMFIYFCTS